MKLIWTDVPRGIIRPFQLSGRARSFVQLLLSWAVVASVIAAIAVIAYAVWSRR